MSQFEIGLYTSDALYYDCNNEFGNGYEGVDRAAEFIEGAFNRSSSHSVTVRKSSNKIQAPQEAINSSFEAEAPCTSITGTWDDLRDWWDYYVNDADCKSKDVIANDCNLLLTAASGGGLGGPREAAAGGIFTVAKNYSSYQKWDADPAFNQVDTLLEEVGHTLVTNMVDNDYQFVGDKSGGDGQTPHDSARLYDHNGKYAITPIGITGDTEYNNCGQKVDKYLWDGDAWEARYSPCTEEYFQVR